MFGRGIRELFILQVLIRLQPSLEKHDFEGVRGCGQYLSQQRIWIKRDWRDERVQLIRRNFDDLRIWRTRRAADDCDAYARVSPDTRMIVHRIATRDLSSEAFLSNLIDYLALRTAVARVIEKPLLVNGDAMEERNASFTGYMHACRRELHHRFRSACEIGLKTSTRQAGIIMNRVRI